ncbi:MAG: hybrid sensor histidine kinase/response regulator, partial [Gammaproteobacteria bacterium]
SLQQFHYSPESLVEVPVVSLLEYQEAIAEYEEYRSQLQVVHDISSMPVMEGDFGEFKEVTDLNSEAIRVPANVMEQMINLSGESVINRARVDMGISGLTNNIEEMGTTVHRLADQLRRMDAELEEQILSQIEDDNLLESENFDPLEMDQYSSLNQLSKALSESASDLVDIKATLLEKVRDSENLLLQLARTQAELQDSLMNSRMVPFSRLTPRLQRVVRQVNKQVELTVINADGEMDRSILERITSPLEHMLRNAVDHGIESREERAAAGKSEVGRVTLSISREGSELVIQLSDDGHGIDVQSVRNKAIKQGLIDPNDESLTDADIMQYIFNAGLSTTKKVTQISGRGVGMDVVRSEIRQLGGAVSVESVKGQGSRFVMRVPLTVAVSDALVVRAADTHYVIPLVQIERVEQVNPDELFAYYQSDHNTFTISDVDYRLRYLNEILTGNTVNDLAVSGNSSLPVIIIKNQTGQNLALQVDEIVGSRMEVVVKPLGKQLSHVSGVSAATIMGDGSIMLILDLIALIRNAPIRQVSTIEQQPLMDERKKILVIDDSVTVRKVTSRFLEREGFDAHVAKDGVDALKILQEFTPDLILL